MSENQDSGEIMRGTDDLNEVSAEDVPEVRCAETEILKDAESPLRDRDDSEVLTNQYDESLLVNISDEEEMDFESADEILEESDSDQEEFMTIAELEAQKRGLDGGLDEAVNSWRNEIVDEIENDAGNFNNVVPIQDWDDTTEDLEFTDHMNKSNDQNEELDSTGNIQTKRLDVSIDKESNAMGKILEEIVDKQANAASPTLRLHKTIEELNLIIARENLVDTKEEVSDEGEEENEQRLITLLDETIDEEDAIEQSTGSSMIDETSESDFDLSTLTISECYKAALLEDIGTEELNGLIGVLMQDHNESMENSGETKTRPFTVLIEGNIGSGKTTFLKHFSKFSNIEVITEPVEKWTNVKGSNLLQKMYEDPERWAFVFQTYVQLTMLQQHTENNDKQIKIMERSLYSARYCFIENLFKSGKIQESEYTVLVEWFEFLTTRVNEVDLGVDLIVYLRTSPEKAMERIQSRSRGEESLIPMIQVKNLHDLYEKWLIKEKFPRPAPVVTINADKNIEQMVEEYIKQEPTIFGGNEKNREEEVVAEIDENLSADID